MSSLVSTMKVLVILSVCVALISVGVAAQDDCGYVPVNSQYFDCLETAYRDAINRMYMSFDLSFLVKYACRKKEAFFTCMEEYALGCSNGDAIMNETYAALEWCDGNDAADWITNGLLPAGEAVTEECIVALRPNIKLGVCGALFSYDDIRKERTIQEGLQNMRRLKTDMLGCVRRVFKVAASAYDGPDCPGVTWTNIYNKFILAAAFFPPPFGAYLERSDAVGIEEDEAEQIKRAGMPFFWV